jgi:peptidoglycan/LPS O-acetylase OafA/YrhL
MRDATPDSGTPSEPLASAWRLGYRPALDGIRGIAVLMVMGYHFALPGFQGGGHMGVTIFFALSGFLITALLLEERAGGRIELGRFYVRRARRLLPALVALVAVVLLIALLRGGLDEAVPQAAAVLLYVSNWGQYSEPISFEHLSHTWSLGVEEQFYLVWPLLLVAAYAVGGRRGVLSAALGVAAVTIGLRLSGLYLAELERAVDTLMVGAAVAVVAVSGRLSVSTRAGVVALVALLLMTALTTWPEARAWAPLAVGVAVGVLVAAVVTDAAEGPLARLLSWRPLVLTGKISYGLYLWHFAIAWELWPALNAAGWHWLPAALVLGALTYVAAFASWRYVERPLLRGRTWKRVDVAEPLHSPQFGTATSST